MKNTPPTADAHAWTVPLLDYIFAGLALGGIYAIAAAALVTTYVSAGILNFALGSMAFTVARFYYFLNTEQGWGIAPAAAVSLGIFAPLLGVALYSLLFRHLRLRSNLIKVVATIGLSVALPPAVHMIFGTLTSRTAPGLAPVPLKVFHPFGASVNADQVATYVGVLVVLILGTVVLRFTDVGLKVRALVDSEALTSLSGVHPSRVSLGVWAVSSTLAGLAGILLTPTAGLSAESMTFLMTAAFAAVVAAKLHSVPIAVSVAFAMGLTSTIVQKYLDPEGDWSARVVPAVPFLFMLVFLVYFTARGQASETGTGGALDRAVRADSAAQATATSSGARLVSPTLIGPAITLAVVVLLIMVLSGYWIGLVGAGLALSIALLSFTLVTGEGGMIWLCQITFAGFGAILSAELATAHGWSPLLAVFLGALFIVPIGLVLGLLTIKLGDLYVALVTLTFGLLAQTLVFTDAHFYNFGAGTPMTRPAFADGTRSFAFLTLGVFLIIGLVIVNLRRSTSGLALSAVRYSPNGARTLGLSVLQAKLLVSALATYVAAVGGGFLAMQSRSSLPDAFNVFLGLVWLAVLVTIGSRSIVAALVAGLSFHLLPGVFTTYLPSGVAEVPVVLFGIGAILVAKDPEGVIATNARQLANLVGSLRSNKNGPGQGPPPPQATAPDDATADVADVAPTRAGGKV